MRPSASPGFTDLWHDEILSCTILTIAPNETMATIHDRMPVILSPNDYDRWLDPGITDPAEVQNLLKPYPGEMQAHPVSGAVNSPRNNSLELLIPA